MAGQDIKKAIIQEYTRCKSDPVYFMKKYCYIQHPQRGRILFKLYPFQEEILKLYKDNNFLITLKSRQLGISTVSAGYALWLMLFHKDKNILALATTQTTARNLVTKTIYMYESLPKWMQIKHVEKNKLSLRLKNGSRIIAKSSNTDAARSEAVSLLLIDEAAFIDNIEETYTAAQQTLATGGQCMVLSTPNGVGNWFHQTWEKAKNKENSFIPVKLPWTVHPERDQKWRDQQNRDLGPRMASQECDCSFLSSGATVFEPQDLLYYEKEVVQEPVERRGVDSNLWIWQQVDYSKSYMVVADVSRGDSTDFSTFHILDIDTCEQVAEYKGKLSPKEFGNVLVGIASEYNDALLVVENANIGWSTIEQIQERAYRNLYHSPSSKKDNVESYMRKYERDQLTPGFTNSAVTRPLVIAKIMEYVKEKDVIIKSSRLLAEMRVFIWKNGKAQAQIGYNDDLMMAFAIGLYVRDSALRLRSQGTDTVRAQLNTFAKINSRERREQQINTPTIFKSTDRRERKSKTGVHSMKKNPYINTTQKGSHDYSWVFN